MTTTATTAMQLICIGRAGKLATPPGTRAIEHAGLTAIVIDVDSSDFTGETGERNLADVVWLSTRAGEHDRLIAASRGDAGEPALPARFGTLFVTEDSLGPMLERHAAPISAFLDQVAGREEWSVKIIADPAAATKALAARMARERGIDAGSPGAKYLLMRKIEQDAAAKASAFMAERSSAVLSSLASACADVRLGRSGKRLDDGTEVVASASLLVDRSREDVLHRLLESSHTAAATDGLTITCTGPWPPYSFAPSLGGD